ncbi:MAG: helix-turn-helix domain-containing protein [Arachidicoccus sp.]
MQTRRSCFSSVFCGCSYSFYCFLAMPRGKSLTEREIGQIEAFHSEGLGIREIARKINRSHNLVMNWLEKQENYGKKNKKRGRKKKLSKRDERQIIRKVSNTTKSCAKIKQELGLDVHRQTVWRTINKNPNIFRQKMNKAPRLEPVHIRGRLEFARNNMGRQWNLVGSGCACF